LKLSWATKQESENDMKTILHITSGDCAGESLKKSGISGDLLVWHDILYDGPRQPGWPGDETLKARALFLEKVTAGGMSKEHVLQTLKGQYQKLAAVSDYDPHCLVVRCMFV
jgi:hypothetical protein